jgi:xanthine dehydrogenase YagR molybdenum-binding subunit
MLEDHRMSINVNGSSIDLPSDTGAHKVDVLYRTPRHNHNPIELHAATVGWDGDNLILHDASQCVTHTAWSIAEVFGIKEEQAHVTSPYVGGGFGSKTLWRHQILALD